MPPASLLALRKATPAEAEAEIERVVEELIVSTSLVEAQQLSFGVPLSFLRSFSLAERRDRIHRIFC